MLISLGRLSEELRTPLSFAPASRTTSLHGWRFLSPDRAFSANKWQRFWLNAGWAAVVLGSIGVAVFFLSNSVIDFLSSTVQTTQDTSRWEIHYYTTKLITLSRL